jgi:hypothetical protein
MYLYFPDTPRNRMKHCNLLWNETGQHNQYLIISRAQAV